MATAKKDPKRDPALLDRLDVWARAFTKRPDVNVNVHTRGKPWKSADGSIYAGPEILAFYTGANGYSLEWCLRDQPDVVSTLSIPSYKSTVVVFNPFRPLGQFTATFANAMLLDAVRGKNKTLAARPKLSSKTATVISLFTGRTFDSFEAYLTEGARSAFASGWQWGSAEVRATLPWCPEGSRSWEPAEPIRAQLSERSLPADAPLEAIAARLEERGLSAAEAQSLVAWLGVDARLAAG